MDFKSPYKEILLYHGLGAGKTCASIGIAEGIKDSKQVIIMTPASLRMNYISELKHCGDPLYKINQHWEFKELNDTDVMYKFARFLGINEIFIKKNITHLFALISIML